VDDQLLGTINKSAATDFATLCQVFSLSHGGGYRRAMLRADAVIGNSKSSAAHRCVGA
jgi:hypothetical protein